MTVKHIIGECPLSSAIRRRNFKLANDFKEIMNEGNSFDPERIFDVLREIELLNHIYD